LDGAAFRADALFGGVVCLEESETTSALTLSQLFLLLWLQTAPIVFQTRLVFPTSLWVADRRPLQTSAPK